MSNIVIGGVYNGKFVDSLKSPNEKNVFVM